MDAIKVEDAPAHGVRLAAAELRLRIQEEQRRRDIGLKDVSDIATLSMSGQPGKYSALISLFMFISRQLTICNFQQTLSLYMTSLIPVSILYQRLG